MRLEDSPSSDLPRPRGHVQRYVARLNARLTQAARRWRPWLVRGLTLLCAMALVYLIVRLTLPAPLPGGLDGCLHAAGGAPLTARVRIAGQSVITSADGCFFFAALPAGPQTVIVDAPGQAGQWKQTVEISAGQAVGLGDVTVVLTEATP